jgi:hypothetical protein
MSGRYDAAFLDGHTWRRACAPSLRPRTREEDGWSGTGGAVTCLSLRRDRPAPGAPSILGPTPTGASYLINNVVRRVHAFGRACILAYTLTSRTSRHAWTVAHAY